MKFSFLFPVLPSSNLFSVLILLLFFAIGNTSRAQVKLTEVQWKGVGCYKIEMPMGVVYFEKDNGVSGIKSFIDNEGNDWIASNMEPGPNGEFRGFPNSKGDFGHAGRNSNSRTKVLHGKTQGDFIILESSNPDFCFQYWFFPDRVVVKVLKSKGNYAFLYEGVIGGSAEEEDFFVTPDGKKHTPKGQFDDFSPEWFYLGDPKVENLLFLAKSPDDDAPNENHRQIREGNIHNMDLYSFGRTGPENGYEVYGMNGNEHICIIGFINGGENHDKIKKKIESFLKNPFKK